MNVKIYPSKAVGEVSAPPSKSVAHRALLCGALTKGCTVTNLAFSQDIEATLRCIRALGGTVQTGENAVTVGGLDPFAIPQDAVLDCGESGSTLRFILPLCLLSGRKVILRGHGRLMERPLTIYEDLCAAHDFSFHKTGDSVTVSGALESGVFRVPGNVSSQFITGMLFALSLLPGESRLEVVGALESSSYVDITLMVLRDFGITVRREENTFILPGNGYYSSDYYTVEGDCSNAAFLEGFNLLGGSVKVDNLSEDTAQGDRVYHAFYKELRDGYRQFDLSDCPDLGPVMFALSAACGGGEFIGTARLKLKESDRCAAMAAELSKFGITMDVRADSVTVRPGKLRIPSGPLCGHNDHRIVMALSLLCSVVGGTILGAEAVAKSYPDYFDVLKQLGIEWMNDDI